MRETSCLSSCRDAKSSRQICQMWWSKETWTHQKRRIRQTSCLSFCRDAKSSRQILAQICRMCQMWKLKETCMNQKRPMRETSCQSFCRDAKSSRQIVAQICRMCHVLINRDANTSKKTYSNKPLQECQRCQMWKSKETYTDQNRFIKETSCLRHRHVGLASSTPGRSAKFVKCYSHLDVNERWGAGVEYHIREFNEPYAPS